MSERPLISVITPTYDRHDLLLETIEDVRRQTYPNIEHVIVSDGLDLELAGIVTELMGRPIYAELDPISVEPDVPITFAECGRHWTGLLSESYAAAPVIVGQFLARGEYACLWADDQRAMDPDHLTKMVDLIEASGADFVYPIVEVWWRDEPTRRRLIWADPPVDGSIAHWLYRPSMIEKAKGPYRTHVGHANDWDFIKRAMAGGATWAFLPEITFSHRADLTFSDRIDE